MQNWAKTWAPIAVGAGMTIVCTAIALLLPNEPIWILVLLLCGISLTLIGIYGLLHGFIYECYKTKKLHLLFIITLIIGFAIGITTTHLFYKDKVGKLEKLVLTPEQIESKVWNWLAEPVYGSNYSASKSQDEENTHFCFIATNEDGDNIEIRLFKSQETLLKFRNNLKLSSDVQEAINKLSPTELKELLFNIKNSLNNAELGFEAIEPLKIIILKDDLFVEALTRSSFFEVLKRLKRGRAMTGTSLYTTLGKS